MRLITTLTLLIVLMFVPTSANTALATNSGAEQQITYNIYDDDFEDEDVKKEKKNKENCLKVTFKKIGTKFNEAWGGLYDSVNEDFANNKA